MKKILSIFLRVGISIALLIFLFRQVDAASLIKIIKNTNMPILFWAGFIFFFNYILCLFRWEMLLKAAKIHLRLKRVIISFAGGVFFSLFLPSTIGGDVMRSIDLATHTKRPKEVVATVLLDRLSGYIGLAIVALLAVLFGVRFIQDKSVFISVGIITAILVIILLVLFNKFLYSRINRLLRSRHLLSGRQSLPALSRIREIVRNLHQEMHIFRHHEKIIFNNLILSLLIQIVSPLSFYIIALSIGVKINPVYYFIFIPIIGAITLLPISIGGLGLRDASTIYFFAQAGVTKDLSFAMSLLSFCFIIIYSAIGGLIYVLTIHHRRVQHH